MVRRGHLHQHRRRHPVLSARLNADGTLDKTFAPTLNGSVQTLVVQSTGQLLVGGNFTSIDGISRNFIARLNSDGSVTARSIPMRTARST